MEIQYIRVGDYFIPDLELPEETRPIGKWGWMHRDYLREHKPIQYNCLRKRQIYPRKGTAGHQLRYPAENQNMSVTGASPRNASTASPMASRNASSAIQEQVE